MQETWTYHFADGDLGEVHKVVAGLALLTTLLRAQGTNSLSRGSRGAMRMTRVRAVLGSAIFRTRM